MRLQDVACRLLVAALWGWAIWASWEGLALYGDGSLFLVEVVHKGWFWHPEGVYDRARQYAIGLNQVPLVIGLRLGVQDLHWLARLQSFGAFAVPTALYHLALVRARHDVALQTAVVAAIALVYLTTSYFIVGEYNTAFALSIAASIIVATADRPRVTDGVLLVLLGLLAVRTYEALVAFGPLLSILVFRSLPGPAPRISAIPLGHRLVLAILLAAQVVLAFAGLFVLPALVALALVAALLLASRDDWRSAVARALHILAGHLFLVSSIVAALSCVSVIGMATLAEDASGFSEFWTNARFVMALMAALAALALSLRARTGRTGTNLLPWAAVPLAIILFAPVLAEHVVWFCQTGRQHYAARLAAAPIAMALACFAGARKSGIDPGRWMPAAFVRGVTEGRYLAFLLVLIGSMIPSQASFAISWVSFLDAARDLVRTRQGVIPVDRLASPTCRQWGGLDIEFIPYLSLALRSKPGDGIIEADPNPAPLPLPEIGPYVWRARAP